MAAFYPNIVALAPTVVPCRSLYASRPKYCLMASQVTVSPFSSSAMFTVSCAHAGSWRHSCAFHQIRLEVCLVTADRSIVLIRPSWECDRVSEFLKCKACTCLQGSYFLPRRLGGKFGLSLQQCIVRTYWRY